jgi:PAS domain S-box-containing protein
VGSTRSAPYLPLVSRPARTHATASTDATALARLKPLLEIAATVRGERDFDEVLGALAETISAGLGWKTVLFNLYRPAWDDFQVRTVFGNDDAREALFGATSRWPQWRPLLNERFKRGDAYLTRHDDVQWEDGEVPTFFPASEQLDAPDAWDASQHALVVPLAHSDGHLIGILSVDEPESGRLPSDEEVELLCAVAAQAARAVEQVQSLAESARHRAALEHLHEVSTRLTALVAPEVALEAIAHGIRSALDFEKVCVLLREGDGFTPSALAGWDPEDPAVQIKLSYSDLERLCVPQFEIEGCYLLAREDALERCTTGSDYASKLNGLGPRAWNRHWLLAPLRDERGEVVGFIWSDDPGDRLLPSHEKLRVLRMFANHAATSLELARTIAAEHEATELLRASITASPLAIFTLDANAVIRSWNTAAERMYGWPADELVGMSYPLASPEQKLEVEHLLRAVLDGQSFRGVDVVRIRRDGKRLEVSASAAPLRDADGNVTGAIVLHEDITERKSAERELERRHREQRSLHHTTLDLLETLDENGVLKAIVARACDLLHTEDGYVYLLDDAADELVLRHGTGVFVADLGARLDKGEGLSGRVWEAGETVSVDNYRRWTGRSKAFDDDAWQAVAGVPLRSRRGFLGVLGVGHRDGKALTADELSLLEQFGRLASLALENARLFSEVRKSQELHRRVLETSTDVMTLFALDGTVTFASRAVETVFGWTPDEVVGMNFVELIHPDDLEAANDVITAALEDGVSRPSIARMRHKDGRWVLVEGKPAVIRDERGEPELVLGISRDITERTEAEERRRELEQQLRMAQKMEAVGSLAGGIAHDFNNLLTAIAGYGGLALGAAGDEQEELRADIQEMLGAAERARQLIRQLLAFSRKQVLQPCVLDLNEVVEDMESILRRLIGEDVELVTMLDEELGSTNADPGQIEQVVMNLCINARDAMTDGGRVVVETFNADLDEKFVATHVGARPGPCVALRVTDTGHGMDDDVRARVFEPFFSTKEEAKGTGLGLSTVYGIVKQSGGYIWCDSAPGYGTAFTVYLPRFESAPDSQSRPEAGKVPDARGTETVLLAEDEQVVRRLVHEMLERLGYSVIPASNGAEALEQLDEHDGPIDLLVTDVVMPGMSGRELAGIVRERRPDTRVLFMSGYAEDAIASHGVLQPGTALLEKPFTASGLGEMVRAVLDRG